MIDKTKFLLEVMKLEFLYRVELKKYNVLNIIGIGKAILKTSIDKYMTLIYNRC